MQRTVKFGLIIFHCIPVVVAHVWMLVILFNAVSCFYYFHEEEENFFTWDTFVCVHHQDIQFKIEGTRISRVLWSSSHFSRLLLYCYYHFLLLHLHQAHFNPQIRLPHQIDSPKLSPVQHLLYLSQVIS